MRSEMILYPPQPFLNLNGELFILHQFQSKLQDLFGLFVVAGLSQILCGLLVFKGERIFAVGDFFLYVIFGLRCF